MGRIGVGAGTATAPGAWCATGSAAIDTTGVLDGGSAVAGGGGGIAGAAACVVAVSAIERGAEAPADGERESLPAPVIAQIPPLPSRTPPAASAIHSPFREGGANRTASEARKSTSARGGAAGTRRGTTWVAASASAVGVGGGAGMTGAGAGVYEGAAPWTLPSRMTDATLSAWTPVRALIWAGGKPEPDPRSAARTSTWVPPP